MAIPFQASNLEDMYSQVRDIMADQRDRGGPLPNRISMNRKTREAMSSGEDNWIHSIVNNFGTLEIVTEPRLRDNKLYLWRQIE